MSNQHKQIATVFGFIIVSFLCYKLTVSKTITLKKDYTDLNQQEILFNSTPKQLSVLKNKKVYYDSILTTHSLKGSSIQNNLLGLINTNSYGVRVVAFIEPIKQEKNGVETKLYQFTLQGGYNQLSKLIYQLEQHTKFGEIINLHFEKLKNYRTNSYYLQAHVLLKSYG